MAVHVLAHRETQIDARHRHEMVEKIEKYHRGMILAMNSNASDEMFHEVGVTVGTESEIQAPVEEVLHHLVDEGAPGEALRVIATVEVLAAALGEAPEPALGEEVLVDTVEAPGGETHLLVGEATAREVEIAKKEGEHRPNDYLLLQDDVAVPFQTSRLNLPPLPWPQDQGSLLSAK
jgi:hypothetical protein